MPDITRKIQSLEDTSTHIPFQVVATKTAFKTHQKNVEQLQTATQDTVDQNSTFQGSRKMLS
jgi:hypothetical protein